MIKQNGLEDFKFENEAKRELILFVYFLIMVTQMMPAQIKWFPRCGNNLNLIWEPTDLINFGQLLLLLNYYHTINIKQKFTRRWFLPHLMFKSQSVN